MATGTKLSDLVYGVRAEAGHSLKDAHGTSMRDTIVYLLQSTQRRLWKAHDWPLHCGHVDIEGITPGERYVNYPDKIDPTRVDKIEIRWDEKWYPLTYGIGAAQYNEYDSDNDERTFPIRRWDQYHIPGMQAGQLGQIEVWPLPSDMLTLRVHGHERLQEMTDDESLSTLDGDMLILYVAGRLLARSNKADSQLKLQEADSLRRNELSQSGSDRSQVTQYGGPTRVPRASESGITHVSWGPGTGG